MSTLKVNTIQNIGGTDLLAPLQSGSAKAWVKFKGTGTVSMYDSFNISSMTDNGTGSNQFSFINDLANQNYAAIANSDGFFAHCGGALSNYQTTSFKVFVLNISGNNTDRDFNSAVVLGD